MQTCKIFSGIAAASFISITGQAAFADVTARQVWDDWQSYMKGFGYQIEAQETDSGNKLSVSDIRMVIPVPEEKTEVTITLSEMTLTERGDGTVGISIPEVLPMVISVTGDGAENAEVTVNYKTRGLDMIVSGDAQDMTYTYSADMVGIDLAKVVAEGQTLDVGTATLEIADVSGTTGMSMGTTLRTATQSLTSGAVSYAGDFKDPEGSAARVVVKGGSDSVKMQARTEIPTDLDLADMGAALAAGFAIEGGYEFGPGSMNIDFNDEGESFQGSTRSDGGNFAIVMNNERLHYNVATRNVTAEAAGSEIPFPVSLTMKEMAFSLLTPVSKGDEAQDFAALINLSDFTMSDMIWGIFDPSGQLPRDPATVVMDVSGKVKLLVDLLNPAQMEAVESGDTMPGELQSVTLKDLTIRAVGAELTGTGAIDVDNTDMTSYDGMPKPVGSVNLKLVGANALLDKLIEMGFVSSDDAMGARMMMGLFAVPGSAEDTLTSEIKFTDEGQVLANGQRLK